MSWKIQFDTEHLSIKEQNTICFAAKVLKKYLEKANTIKELKMFELPLRRWE